MTLTYEQVKTVQEIWAKRAIFFMVCVICAMSLDAAYRFSDWVGAVLVMLLWFIATEILFEEVKVEK